MTEQQIQPPPEEMAALQEQVAILQGMVRSLREQLAVAAVSSAEMESLLRRRIDHLTPREQPPPESVPS